jgi:hypothetical protein
VDRIAVPGMQFPGTWGGTAHTGPRAGPTRLRRLVLGRVRATEELIRRRRRVEDDGDDPDDGALSAVVAWGWVAEGHEVILSRRLLMGTGACAKPCG